MDTTSTGPAGVQDDGPLCGVAALVTQGECCECPPASLITSTMIHAGIAVILRIWGRASWPVSVL